MHRSLRRLALTATALAGALVGAAVPAHAEPYLPPPVHWIHPLANEQTYYLPGGPTATYLSGCVAKSTLLKTKDYDWAELYLHWEPNHPVAPSRCNVYNGFVTVVVKDAAGLHNGPREHTYYNIYREHQNDITGFARSKGQRGQAIVGAHYDAANDAGVWFSWDVTTPPPPG
jgi:hypothetical protein